MSRHPVFTDTVSIELKRRFHIRMPGTLPPGVGYKVLADSVLALLFFLGNVFVLENFDLAPLEVLMREFGEVRKAADPAP